MNSYFIKVFITFKVVRKFNIIYYDLILIYKYNMLRFVFEFFYILKVDDFGFIFLYSIFCGFIKILIIFCVIMFNIYILLL